MFEKSAFFKGNFDLRLIVIYNRTKGELSMKIVVTGGGTGGHFFPALLIAERLIKDGNEVNFLGNPLYLEKEGAEKRNIPFFPIPSKNTLKKDIPFLIDNAKGIFIALKTLRQIKPHVIYSTGGFTTAPVIAAARILGIPFVIHEQNAIVGLVNRVFRSSSSSFIHSYPYEQKNGEKVIGNLSRFSEIPKRQEQFVTFMGGSGGAHFINELALAYAKNHPSKKVVLISGKNYDLQNEFPNLTIHSFVDKIVDIYKNSEIVIARAGSTTLSELSFLGIPSIIIPMPNSADNHQEKNADFYDLKHAIIKISQDEFTYQTLVNALNKINKAEKKRLSTNIKFCYNKNAEDEIIQEIRDIVRNQKRTLISFRPRPD